MFQLRFHVLLFRFSVLSVMFGGLALLVPTAASLAQSFQPDFQFDQWFADHPPGFHVYQVVRENGDRFEFSCDVAFTEKGGATAIVVVQGLEPAPNSDVEVTIDGTRTFKLMFDRNRIVRTDCEECAFAYTRLWQAVRLGNRMSVRLANGQTGEFPLKGTAAVIPATPCKPDFER